MLRAVIVDDERKSRESMAMLLQMFAKEVEVVEMATSVKSGIESIQNKKPDIIFLDIHMQDGDGFEVLEQLEGENHNIIFVTGHEEHAVRAFRSEAVDYLLKPVCLEDLENAISRVKKRVDFETIAENKVAQITLATNEGTHIIKLADILYCHGEGAYTYFYIKNGKRIITSKNLGEYEKQLGNQGFFRSHKSYLVNMNEIKAYKNQGLQNLTMSNGDVISVSKRRKNHFKAYFD
jgi:two-component system LytT family response regulator